jgi:hypothetical protein
MSAVLNWLEERGVYQQALRDLEPVIGEIVSEIESTRGEKFKSIGR